MRPVRKRLTSFAAKLLILAILATLAVVFTWVRLVGVRGPVWLWAVFPILLTGGFVPALFLGHLRTHPLLPVLTVISGVAIGYLSFLLVAAALAWAVAAGGALLGLAHGVRPAVEWIFFAGFVVATYGLANSVIPRTTRVRVELPGLPPAWQGRTVGLISDIHLGNVRSAAFVRHLTWRLNRAGVDAVFISGDMFDGTVLDLDRAAAGWKALRPPRGAYFVTGNHDERGRRGPHVAALRRAGLRVLENEKVELDGLQVIGIHDADTHSAGRYRALLRRADIAPDRASILLAHQPVNLAVAEEAGVGLQLSGHTHGGQFWPWSLIARRVHGPYVYGLNQYGRMRIYTSSGAGTWGPPFRVGTRSEIVLLRLEAARP
jgi:hypothetical protein